MISEMKFTSLMIMTALLLAGRGAEAGAIHLDQAESRIVAKTGKSGKFSFLGHNHAVLATSWNASLCIDEKSKRLVKEEVKIAAGALVIDTPEARKAAGLGESTLSDITRNKIQERMLGGEILAAAKYPAIEFSLSSPQTLSEGKITVTGRLSLHGQTHDQAIEARYALDGGRFKADGNFKFLQSRFGINREKVMGGTVEVADEIEIDFHLEGTLNQGPCGD
jgi:polyisoprenoid-binding protein YceI